MREVKIITFLVIMAALSVSVSYAATPVTERKDAKRQQLYNGLNLTSEQKKLLEENRNKHREQKKVLFEEIREKTASIRQELQKDELTMDKINQSKTELKKLHAQMLDDWVEGILEVRKILTPEQFKKFVAKTQERTSHFKNKWEKAKGGF